MRKLFTTVVLALFVGLFAASASASTGGSTLVNVPASTVCQFHTFKVGVWAQGGTSLPNRRYIVNVWSPLGVRVLHKEGYAPEAPAGWADDDVRTAASAAADAISSRSTTTRPPACPSASRSSPRPGAKTSSCKSPAPSNSHTPGPAAARRSADGQEESPQRLAAAPQPAATGQNPAGPVPPTPAAPGDAPVPQQTHRTDVPTAHHAVSGRRRWASRGADPAPPPARPVPGRRVRSAGRGRARSRHGPSARRVSMAMRKGSRAARTHSFSSGIV
jgi:hypothetical protein